MTEILPRLYVGGLFDATSQERLQQNNITHIVSVHDAAKPLDVKRKYLCIQASDLPQQDLSDYFPLANDFIHEGRLNGKLTLVHCLVGMSRSVTLVAAYIMTLTELPWDQAINVVRGARRLANPNLGFKKQLRMFQNQSVSEERQRFRAKYPTENEVFDDLAVCQRLLATHDRWVQFGDKLQDDGENWLVEEMADQSSVPDEALGS